MERTLALETTEKIGEKIKLQGWIDRIRDHGKITFIDLRDRSGVVQVVVEQAGKVSSEDVIEITGTVAQRPESLINPNLETGRVEVSASSVEILNPSKPLPFPINTAGHDIDEEVRLKYRYLDLRRERMQKIVRLRSKLYQAFRQALDTQDFVEVETPILTKSTKEGARDFVVPSRFYPGKFYALPQSPQQYKQLLMTAGIERYYQIARCIRDEDLRADRGFEFTQLDLEISFATQEMVMQIVEEAVKQAVKQVGGKLQKETFPVIDYDDAIKKYGEDKFDLRTEDEKKANVLAFAWVVNFPFFKKVDKQDVAETRDGKSGWTFTHNPFSQPKSEHIQDHLEGKNLDKIITSQYDLVCNGYEVGGGSIRAHSAKVLRQTFKIMGYSDSEIEESVGHMLQAFEYGTPPHGGIALGLDRLVMLLAGETSLKETIAFPMTSRGRTAVMDAPTEIAPEQIKELGLQSGSIDKSKPVSDQIQQKLSNLGVKFQVLEHEPIITSQEAAKARKSSEAQGAKSLIMKADDQLIMVVVPGDKKADTKAIKKKLNFKSVEMASKDVVEDVTKVEIGGVPPMGSLFDIPTYVDKSLAENQEIYMNAGSKSLSIKLSYEDYLRLEQPQVETIAKT